MEMTQKVQTHLFDYSFTPENQSQSERGPPNIEKTCEIPADHRPGPSCENCNVYLQDAPAQNHPRHLDTKPPKKRPQDRQIPDAMIAAERYETEIVGDGSDAN